MSDLRIERIGHDGDNAFGRQLLALHQMRRCVERDPGADQPVWWAAMAMTSVHLLRELCDLVAALDRRVPQVERAGEAAIARDAAALRARALKRIEELERVPAPAEST